MKTFYAVTFSFFQFYAVKYLAFTFYILNIPYATINFRRPMLGMENQSLSFNDWEMRTTISFHEFSNFLKSSPSEKCQ